MELPTAELFEVIRTLRAEGCDARALPVGNGRALVDMAFLAWWLNCDTKSIGRRATELGIKGRPVGRLLMFDFESFCNAIAGDQADSLFENDSTADADE